MGDGGAIYPLRLFEAPLPKGEARGLCKRGKQLDKSEFSGEYIQALSHLFQKFARKYDVESFSIW